MFTGIIEAIGQIIKRLQIKGDVRLNIRTNGLDLADVKLGDSIAFNGVCLTVIEITAETVSVDVSAETLSCTSLNYLAEGDHINLEKALLPSARLGGHLVSGHVDGLARIVDMGEDARSVWYRLEVPQELAKFIAAKGSVCVDGVSLTVNTVKGREFTVNIIPHTMHKTIFQYYQVGQQVNIEVDLIARYLNRFATYEQEVNRG